VIKQGMDTPYRVTFYLSTLLFFGFSLWGYQLQLRLARVAERSGALAEGAEEPRFEAVRKPVAEQ